MVPWKDGKANRGHSCVKGRFAWGYATHQDRILNPMVREKITDPWREVSWDEAIAHVAKEFRRIQASTARAPSAASPRRAAPTRRPSWCRSWCAPASATTMSTPAPASAIRPPATASSKTFGTSAGTQDFDSVEHADVVMVIGANPTDGHPVFASRLKKRLRQGAKLIVIDPRRIDLVRSPHIEAEPSPAAAARHQCRGAQRARPCDRDRRPVRRGLHPRALRLVGIRGLGQFRRRSREFARGGSPNLHRRAGGRAARRGPALRHAAATARSTTASASPSTARARPW
jgi:NADH dehydrogenase/NADH:ubiquinone oxidoreductase subunit G